MSSLPGLSFKTRGRPAEPSPLHTDVAGFIGRTRRGPRLDSKGRVVATRVEGWRRFVRDFGGLDADLTLTYALRGYFENGGRVAYVARVNGQDDRLATSNKVWDLSKALTRDVPPPEADGPPNRYRFKASSPGRWGEGVRVNVVVRRARPSRYSLVPRTDVPACVEVDLIISAPGETTEYFTGLDPTVSARDEREGRGATIANRLADESLLARLEPAGEPKPNEEAIVAGNFDLALKEKSEPTPSLAEYLDAARALGDQPEVALLAVPSLWDDLKRASDQLGVLKALVEQATELYDRLVLIDPPPELKDADGFARLTEELRRELGAADVLKAAALYAPWLRAPDPFGGVARPLRDVPPSGHVAGVISRIDRGRGTHHTPANVEVLDAVDLAAPLDAADAAEILASGVNPIICRRSRGLAAWGGRTLDPRPATMYLAHRRLVHGLVRAFRRVAEPILFETNGPALRLSLARAMTSVLLEAHRSGALRGDRPEDAFRVQCDDENNPPELVDLGMAICSVSVAPAVPMEFITFRVAVSETKQLEITDA